MLPLSELGKKIYNVPYSSKIKVTNIVGLHVPIKDLWSSCSSVLPTKH